MTTSSRAVLVLLLLASTLTARDVGFFPLRVVADEGIDGLKLALDPAAASQLDGSEEILLPDVPLPATSATASVDLVLDRVSIVRDDAVLVVDGVERPGATLDAGLTMWSGHVAGEPDSDVFLAFSERGSRGWIRSSAGMVHLLAGPGPDGSWDGAVSRLVPDARLRELGSQPGPVCATTDLPTVAGVAMPKPSSTPAGVAEGTAVLPLYECRVAVETDTEYYDLFGDLGAAQAYLLTLFGAVSDQYRTQIGTILTMPYLALYTGADPWTTQDFGGSSIDLLFEFQGAWDGGAAPATADLFHFISGADLGGGVAYLGVICHQDYGFGVSGNISGATPFPVVQGPLNWDFMVTAHELGHNFGTPHTHDFCPTPLDECAPSGYFGACQSTQSCITNGTIMSYCHLCTGGLDNIDPQFHPSVVTTMRDWVVELSCLQPFHGLFAADLGSALAGSSGTPSLDASFADPDTLVLDLDDTPTGNTATLVMGLSAIFAPFKMGVMVPNPQILASFTTPAAPFSIPLSFAGVSLPAGIDLWFQTWFQDAGGPAGFSSTNGIEVELIISDPWPAPVWIAHPSNGLEYALSNPGSFAQARAEAQALGGDIASIDGQPLNDWLVTTFGGTLTQDQAYIGFSDATAEGLFTWVDGAPVTFTNWASGEPNNSEASGEDFGEILFGTGEWNDRQGDGWYTNRAIMARPQ